MTRKIATLSVVALVLSIGVLAITGSAAPAKKGADRLLKNVQTKGLKFRQIGRMSFATDGVLLVADRGNGSVVAIDTGDTGSATPLKKRIDNIDTLIAGALGTKATGVQIVDMVVNRINGRIYLSVIRKQDGISALLTIDGSGKVAAVNLAKARHVRITLPGDGKAKVSNVTGVKLAGSRVLAAGQSGREFASKIYSIPLPLEHGNSAAVYSTETFHVAHGRWETRAPIQSFIPVKEKGKTYIVGSFNCTPIAKFPVDGLENGAKIKGTSVVELGSGNRPVDMFIYKKGGKDWLVTNTDRFHHKRRPIGPSQYWGCRVDMKYLGAKETNEKAARRTVKKKKGPEGMEVIDVLFGVKHIDQFANDKVVVLRDTKGKLSLEPAVLP
ncbi:MAG TPA: hypothetical protein DCE39_19905 [Planctomycetaceae bacterium]|jgi:hypothetical protein|nr:hypothetical protein [Planctomycetaceae bacterium]MCH2588379.1 hypothetical protein [Planctomycetales bacterium]HAA63195.1 hypothetical protein [Planctomycetaceae bacterium]|tara:strand:- start:46 stop:1197 length:1152 start_codon:yes stop_codon:yes gene_type:complete